MATEEVRADGIAPEAAKRARGLVGLLLEQYLTVAVAESLTGGLVCAAMTSVPGSSGCVRGGVITYATDLKASLVDVDAEYLALKGPVDALVAAQMARGAAEVCGAELGLATTGVAGPDAQDGVPVGTVFVAVHDQRDGSDHVEEFMLSGSRAEIRARTVNEVLRLATDVALDPASWRE